MGAIVKTPDNSVKRTKIERIRDVFEFEKYFIFEPFRAVLVI